jgi:hypothetical protein
MPETKSLQELREEEYRLRLEVNDLRRAEAASSGAEAAQLLAELETAEKALLAAEAARAAAEEQAGLGGLVVDTALPKAGQLGAQTTGLDARVKLRLEHVPTAIYHLFTAEETPLVSCRVKNTSGKIRRLRVSSFVERYSARAVDTVELDADDVHEFNQLPALFPDRVKELTEVTRAALNILVEDLDGAVELHKTVPIWLLARTTAPLRARDPATGQWKSMYRYFGAFVTPNQPALMSFLRTAAERHPDKAFVGYQGNPTKVEPQVRALFEALKQDANIIYVNSILDMHPSQTASAQRVRLPRESLADRQANCIDGTVLFASLLEGVSLSPALVIIPGHAFVAWETWKSSGQWKYLETTRIGTHSFEEACARGEYHAQQHALDKTLLPVRQLRSRYGIMPME